MKQHVGITLVILLLLTVAESMPLSERIELREQVREMFTHAYDGYIQFAFPHDELLPLSCQGSDTYGGLWLSLLDAVDTLAIMGNQTEFTRVIRLVAEQLDIENVDRPISVFETNIRVVGGLLAAHLLSMDRIVDIAVHDSPWFEGTEEESLCGAYNEEYDGVLLSLAYEVGERLLPAFDTPTGIPYGTVNLVRGVPIGETKITSVAVGGTNALEFGLLSRLTDDPRFERAAKRATLGLWKYRSPLGLLGNHIDVFSGKWTAVNAGIGSNVDSFYEYLIKAGVYFNDVDYLRAFDKAYRAAIRYLYKDPWYIDAHMSHGRVTWPAFQALQAFWPGMQSLVGALDEAATTMDAFHSLWRQHGFLPEAGNLQGQLLNQYRGYYLRPELAESTYMLYRATHDHRYLEHGKTMIAALNQLRTECGFAALKDVGKMEKEDRMESFFLGETLKYLYLLFDEENFVHRSGKYGTWGGWNRACWYPNAPTPANGYIFNTEAHILPIKAEFMDPLPPLEEEEDVSDSDMKVRRSVHYGDGWPIPPRDEEDPVAALRTFSCHVPPRGKRVHVRAVEDEFVGGQCVAHVKPES